MDGLQALIESLGRHVVSYIGEDRLRRVDIFADATDGTAHVEI